MKSTPNHSRLRAKQAFTLVEVLVSSFLTLIIMGMLFAVLMGTINAWEGGTTRLRSSGDARLALDILKTDLESMVVRQTQYNQEWLVSYPVTEDGITSTWLTFFAPSLDRDPALNPEGDIVAISYRTAYQDPISSKDVASQNQKHKIFGLYKSMATTINTFQNILGKTNILDEYWNLPVASPQPKASAGFLAPNVVNFDVAWWVRENTSSSLLRIGPDRVVRLGNQLRIGTDPNNPDNVTAVDGKIEAVDVSITTISDEGMRRYAFLNDVNKLDQITQEFGRVHTLRIPINY